MKYAAWAFAVVGCVAVGAYLVVNDHPLMGLVAMLISGCIEIHSTSDK